MRNISSGSSSRLAQLAVVVLQPALFVVSLWAQPSDGYDYAGALGAVKATLTAECTKTETTWDGTASYSIAFTAGPFIRGDDVFVAYEFNMIKTLNAASGMPGRVINQAVYIRGAADNPTIWCSVGALRAKYPAFEGKAMPLKARLERGLSSQQTKVLAIHQAVREQAKWAADNAAFYAAERDRLNKKWGDLVLQEHGLNAHLPSSLKGDDLGLTAAEKQTLDRANLERASADSKGKLSECTAALENTMQRNLDDYLLIKKALVAAQKPDAEQSTQDQQDIAVGRTLLAALQNAEPAKP